MPSLQNAQVTQQDVSQLVAQTFLIEADVYDGQTLVASFQGEASGLRWPGCLLSLPQEKQMQIVDAIKNIVIYATAGLPT